MDVKSAIMAFSQSEKVKAALIFSSHALEAAEGMPEAEKRGAVRTVKTSLDLVGHEIRLAGSLSPEIPWEKVENRLERAMVMLDSGLGSEAVPLLTETLSRVTNIGLHSMETLKNRGLI